MKLLLIRHGQSIDDHSKLSQRNDSPLTTLGVKQSQTRHKSLKHSSFDAVYVSTYKRAKQTAEIVFPNSQLSSLDFIYEIKRPKHLDGGNHAAAVKFWEVTHRADKYLPEWSMDGSESFQDVTKRVKKFIDLLYEQHRESTKIAVVTHGGFMRHIIAYAALGEKYTPEIFFDLMLRLPVKNVDAIECDLRDKKLIEWEIQPLAQVEIN